MREVTDFRRAKGAPIAGGGVKTRYKNEEDHQWFVCNVMRIMPYQNAIPCCLHVR
jgi:hypothetical protein